MNNSVDKKPTRERSSFPRSAATITVSGQELGIRARTGPDDNDEAAYEAHLVEIARDAFQVQITARSNGSSQTYRIERASCPSYEKIRARLDMEHRKSLFLVNAEGADQTERRRLLHEKIKGRQQKLVAAASRVFPPSPDEEILRAEKQPPEQVMPRAPDREKGKRKDRRDGLNPDRFSRETVLEVAQQIRTEKQARRNAQHRPLHNARIEAIIEEVVERRRKTRDAPAQEGSEDNGKNT